jgi:hypothetical protein
VASAACKSNQILDWFSHLHLLYACDLPNEQVDEYEPFQPDESLHYLQLIDPAFSLMQFSILYAFAPVQCVEQSPHGYFSGR